VLAHSCLYFFLADVGESLRRSSTDMAQHDVGLIWAGLEVLFVLLREILTAIL
jgi:hypothetical protein